MYKLLICVRILNLAIPFLETTAGVAGRSTRNIEGFELENALKSKLD